MNESEWDAWLDAELSQAEREEADRLHQAELERAEAWWARRGRLERVQLALTVASTTGVFLVVAVGVWALLEHTPGATLTLLVVCACVQPVNAAMWLVDRALARGRRRMLGEVASGVS